MTDGTSQGLFIVVAIVIFGIFVVLAYILFEDTLSPAMANMFSTATEQATISLYSKNLITKRTLKPFMTKTPTNKVSINSINDVEIYANGDFYTGLLIDGNSVLEENKNYAFEYTIERKSGEITHLGGHLDFSTETRVYLNGVLLDNSLYIKGDPYQRGFEVTQDINYVRVEFNTNDFEGDFYYSSPWEGVRNPIKIQPNRLYGTVDGVSKVTGFKKEYTAVISNIQLTEVVK